MLDLDSAAGGDRRRADDRGHLAGGPGREAAARHGRAAAAGGRAAGGGTATAEDPEHLGRERQRADADGRERGERAAHAAQRGAVLRAAVARAHVLARAAGGLHTAVVGAQQVGLDLGAVGVAGLGGLDEPDAGAHQQRLDGGDGDVQRVRQVGVGHAVDLAHQQRRALLLGQVADVGDEPTQVVAALGLLDRVVQRLARDLEDLGRGRDRPAQMVDAAVVRDAVQPCAHVHLAVVVAQRAVRSHEHVLQHVLGVLARARGQHLAYVREQALPVAVMNDPERLVVARAERRDQLLVGAEAEQTPAEGEPAQTCCGCVEC